jgi:hypothetical protein
MNCLVVSAGVVEQTDGGHQYEAPGRCSACGEDAFVLEEQYPHHQVEGDPTA